jgi:hypothetical protein
MKSTKRAVLSGTGRIVVVLAVVLAGSLVAPGRAMAVDYQYVTNMGFQTCLDSDPNYWWNNPGRVTLYPCHRGNHQRWYAAPHWRAELFEMRTIGPPYGPPNKCLDAWPVAGAPNGYRVTTWDCHGGAQQKWYRIGNLILNDMFDLCLDGWNATVSLYNCHAQPHQLWSLQP